MEFPLFYIDYYLCFYIYALGFFLTRAHARSLTQPQFSSRLFSNGKRLECDVYIFKTNGQTNYV